jgi:hydrogen peroxide-dependent heme synthase
MSELKPMIPLEGLPVLHLFYDLNRSVWDSLASAEQQTGRQRLEALVQEARGWEKFQVITLAMIARADLGFMIIGDDVHKVQTLEKRLTAALGADVLTPVYNYFSLTERSEYTQSEEEYKAELIQKENLAEGSPELEQKLVTFRERIKNYTYYRMYPVLPDWEFFCFYPMRKRRDPGANWYGLDFNKRRELMGGHARVGRKYADKVKQLITGSTGFDDWEWGVSLFAHDPFEVKAIVYEMRFDEVSWGYAEFGEFYTGTVLPMGKIYERLLM